MPPVSDAQRKAMYAAKAGRGKLGIPKKVAEEFTSEDPGGKLPKKVKKDPGEAKERRGGYD